MKFLKTLLDAVNPQGIKCVICGRDTERSNNGICPDCLKKLPFNNHICRKCGVDIRSLNDFCDMCGKNRHLFNEARSVCRYEGAAQSLVYRLKFGGQRYLAKPLAYMMAEVLSRQQWQFEQVAFIPSGKETIKKRGYNQAELIAEEICGIIKKPLADILEKVKESPPQEKLTYKQRFANMEGAFKVKSLPSQSVLVIDDVKTTGATLDEAAKALKASGCKTVYCLTFAARVKPPVLSEL